MIAYDDIIKNSNENNLGIKWNKTTLINKSQGKLIGCDNYNDNNASSKNLSSQSVLTVSESKRIPFRPNTNEGIVSAKINYGRVLKVSPPKYISSNRYSPRPKQHGRRIIRPKTSGQVESIVRRQIRTTPVMVRVNNNYKKKNKKTRRSPRKKTSLVKSIMASNRIYVGTAKTDRAKYNHLKYKKAHRFDKFNHDGFIYYSKKNLTS